MDQSEKRKLEVSNPDSSDQCGIAVKRRMVIGPELPLIHKPKGPEECAETTDESDDDGDFGPSLPPSNTVPPAVANTADDCYGLRVAMKPDPAQNNEVQRDKWMLQPAETADWASRVDPTRLKSRKFQTGKSKSTSSSGAIDVSWTETPEQKMKRLQDEMMGINSHAGGNKQGNSAEDTRTHATQARIKRYNEARKTETLSKEQSHLPSDSSKPNSDDDPSNRAFDREKDMALSSKLSNAERRAMVDRAAGFGSRFTKGKFL